MTTYLAVEDGDAPTRLAWERLTSEQFYSSGPWLNHCEMYPGVRMQRIYVSSGSGAAGTCVTAYDGVRPANYDWTEKYGAAGVTAPAPRALLVGPPMGYQGAILRDSDSIELISKLIADLRDAAKHLTGQAESVAMYLSTQDVAMLRRAGIEAVPLLLEPDAWIELPSGGWEGYLRGLRAGRRNSVRREVRRFVEAGCTISHHDLRDVYTLLPPLAESMAIKYGYPGRALGFLEEFGKYVSATGDYARAALCWHGDELTGFCIYYVWGTTIYLRWASFDYAKLTMSQEYFNLAYYSQIRLASEVGAKRLHAGKNALLAKVLRGATLRPMWALSLSERGSSVADVRQTRDANARLVEILRRDTVLAPAMNDMGEWTSHC